MPKQTLVLTHSSCPYCDEVKKHLASKKNVKFINLNDKEADIFFNKGGTVLVPMAYDHGEFCSFNIRGNEVLLNCNGKIREIE